MATLSFLIQTAIMAYLILGEPVYGKWEYARLVQSASTVPGARVRYYRKVMALEWGLVALVGVALWLGKRSAGTLGFRRPAPDPLALVLSGEVLAALVLPALLVFVAPKVRESLQRQMKPLESLLPVTRTERWWYAATAITAGICEEILFRGFAIAYLTDLLPSAPLALILAAAAPIFGLAHLYQGWRGVLQTGLLGAGLGFLFIRTGSLLLPVILHAALDLRLLALLAAVNRGQPASA